MNEVDRNDRIVAAAGRLPEEISPERDLWPGIAETIDRPQRARWTPMFAQAAAVVLLVGASSGLTYLAMQDDPAPAAIVAPDLLFEPASYSAGYALGPEYLEARSEMSARLDEELARLSPEARDDVEKNLAVIRSAIAEINTALDDEPTNRLLQQLLLNAYQDEFALMRQVGGLTNRVMSRQDI
ncbi:MAG TPA: hypothetical protein VLA06_07045 [Woeseiaceae bacterium]|jgi:hypothetical protein|nr:hypothetical protein [Woeseiaceae bacterium]